MFSLFFWRRSATSASRHKSLPADPVTPSPQSPSAKLAGHSAKAGGVSAASLVLSNKDMEALYHLATIKKLQAGAILHRSDEVASCLYLIIKGSLRLTGGASSHLNGGSALLKKGAWVVDVDLSAKRLWGFNASATEPTVVMLLTQAVIQSLDEGLRGRLLGKVHRLHCTHIGRLTREKQAYAQRSDKLISGMAQLQQSDLAVLEESELITGILGKIPKLPVSTSALVNKLMDSRASTKEVVELVKMDPSLTAEVLKTINSSRYRFDNKISDVNHAVVMLGYDGVYQMVMAEGIRKSLPATDAFTEMYDRSLALSNIAFAVSQATGIGRPAEMATIGLLHDLGMVVIELLKSNNPTMTVLIDLLNHGDMGALLLRSWGIPEIICNTIADQNRPHFCPPAYLEDNVRESVTILYLSGLIFDVMQGRYYGDLQTLFADEYLAFMKWQDKSMNEIGFEVVAPLLKKRRDLLPPLLREIVA